MDVPRYAAVFPDGHIWMGEHLFPDESLWFPEVDHRPFDPPNYHDYLRTNPLDTRDLEWDASDIESETGLPPRHHQGVEYMPGHWRDVNGTDIPGSGAFVRWNEPPARHPHGKRRRLAFVWPSDGKRKRTWGRWKDIFASKGPDIFVSKLGDRPSRNQWRNKHLDFTPEDPGFNTHVDLPWAKRRKPYDFRERKYRNKRNPGDVVWRDATWPRRGADHYEQPLNFRCEHGRWFNMRWAPFGGTVLEGYNGYPPRYRGIFA
ncbi:uncharacterized protein PV09_08611 [Verruconis gallopava]|uniref:Uncharacterized protein n=1 Tax=Verruconis gallopava TaxID=253628 RepID=A0A0D1ZZD9_9PEZI|nr:uncharacterized protein PV09_08611 [Verruconis gallopava]KIV99807.1 hypothetical protein PV09_08611 [Verruconis gallopava]